jgi:diguanylate cyclase (GGDEF)-like protein
MADVPGEKQPLHSPILLVEDDHAIRLLITTVLKKAGYDVTQANDGREALARIAEATPDLIISDVMMPHLDGFGLLTQLRADPSTRTIPLILLTARRAKDDIVSGLDLGADDYLVKPFDKDELLARVRAKIARPPVPVDMLPQDRTTGLLTARHFQQETAREFARAERGGASGVLVYIDLDELPRLRERLGARSEAQIAKQMAALIGADLQPLDLVSRDHDGRFALLLPETDSATAQRRLVVLARRIATHVFAAGGEQLRLTPTIGFTTFDTATSVNLLHTQALIALDTAAMHLDLQPMRYNPAQDAALARRKPAIQATMWARFRAWSRLPAQLVLLGLIALVLPFALYAVLAANGLDITPIAYIIVVLALLITAYLILVEGFKALRRIDPPEEPGATYPPASAIIAAYLPNEAATVVETIEAFLRLTYPGQLQVILAYNTPRDLPMEVVLKELARRDRRFVPLRVADSISKAQNVNAALATVTGEFVGVFDADHHPEPESFTRAWHWLAHGYDVVQGHCLVRNGDESWVARMIAVEFEAIYAASHPGRARLHDFGIFGGSNGYWKTDLLRQTRMHGFMLTEDIDSSIRIIEAGYKIASDPYLISRELATTTLKALWNQRMRWAQGWFQVSLRHTWRGLRSQRLSFRQKLGFVHLLAWREIYPWLSFQMVPIIAFWAWRLGGPDRIDWFVPIFVLTTLFTQSAAIGQTLFAYRLAAPEIRRRRRWFVFYLLVSFLFYTPFKNLIAMVAQIKEALGERQWKVTPRGNVGQDAN